MIIGDSGEVIDVSHYHCYPWYVKYLVEHNGIENHFYEYEGKPPVNA